MKHSEIHQNALQLKEATAFLNTVKTKADDVGRLLKGKTLKNMQEAQLIAPTGDEYQRLGRVIKKLRRDTRLAQGATGLGAAGLGGYGAHKALQSLNNKQAAMFQVDTPLTNSEIMAQTAGTGLVGGGLGNIGGRLAARSKGLSGKGRLISLLLGTTAGAGGLGGLTFGLGKARQHWQQRKLNDWKRMMDKAGTTSQVNYNVNPPTTNTEIAMDTAGSGIVGGTLGALLARLGAKEENKALATALGGMTGATILGVPTYGMGKLRQAIELRKMKDRDALVQRTLQSQQQPTEG